MKATDNCPSAFLVEIIHVGTVLMLACACLLTKVVHCYTFIIYENRKTTL